MRFISAMAKSIMKRWMTVLVASWVSWASLFAQAGEVQVAVAANFAAPMQKIAAQFETDTGHKAVLSFGATGNFYAQIIRGAPFDVLLAADDKTPARLEAEGRSGGVRNTYAVGALVLWSRQPDLVDAQGAVLKDAGRIEKLAMADPKLAPYGQAAVETLTALGLLDQLAPKFVTGQNIAQTWQFVATGNAPLGFVALSQVWMDGRLKEGSAWRVPAHLYRPIRQDAILLDQGRGNPAAVALLDYLRSMKARAVISSYGYGIPD